jgi:hypothetical protein
LKLQAGLGVKAVDCDGGSAVTQAAEVAMESWQDAAGGQGDLLATDDGVARDLGDGWLGDGHLKLLGSNNNMLVCERIMH